MTVAELRQLLLRFPPNSEVVFAENFDVDGVQGIHSITGIEHDHDEAPEVFLIGPPFQD